MTASYERRWIALLLAAGLLVLPGGGAAAQEADTVRTDTIPGDTVRFELPPIEVVTSIAPTAGPRIGSGIPARISTVPGEQIEAWEPRLLADALVSRTGVSSYDDLGSPYKTNLSVRGFNVGPTVGLPPGVSVFLDGVRQNEPDAQEVNMDLLPMEHVKRVELLSGTASLLGPNSLGGAVNLITRRGAGPLTGEVEVSGGSFGAASGEASVSGGSPEGWGYYAAGGYERADGWRDATGAENFNGFLNLDRLGDRRGIAFQLFGAKSRAETAGSLPESVFEVSPTTNFTAGDFEDLNLQQVMASGYLPVGPGLGASTLYFRRSDAERFNVNQPPEDDVRSFTTNHTVGGNLDWRWLRPLGDTELALRVGLDAARNWVDVRIFEEPRADGADADGEADEPEEGGELTTDVESPSADVAGYLIADLRYGRVTFSAGARLDYVRIPFQDLLDPTADTTSTYTRLSPRGGIGADLGGGGSVYASVGASFRAPAILELACADPEAACPLPFALGEDPPLDPVTATTWEVGGAWRSPAVSLEGSAYLTEVRNEIFFIASERSRVEGFFTNLDETRRAGLELALIGQVAGRASLYANYAYTRATFGTGAELFSIRSDEEFEDSPLAGPNDVEEGDRLPLVPEHQAKGGILWGLPGGFEAGLEARYIGEQWPRGDEANETEPLDPYFIADARLGYELGGWEVVGIVTNVFDSGSAVFGTFNENARTGELERFLTPAHARAFKVVLGRRLGAGTD